MLSCRAVDTTRAERNRAPRAALVSARCAGVTKSEPMTVPSKALVRTLDACESRAAAQMRIKLPNSSCTAAASRKRRSKSVRTRISFNIYDARMSDRHDGIYRHLHTHTRTQTDHAHSCGQSTALPLHFAFFHTQPAAVVVVCLPAVVSFLRWSSWAHSLIHHSCTQPHRTEHDHRHCDDDARDDRNDDVVDDVAP